MDSRSIPKRAPNNFLTTCVETRQGAGKGLGPGHTSSFWQIHDGDLELWITAEVPMTRPQHTLLPLEESPHFLPSCLCHPGVSGYASPPPGSLLCSTLPSLLYECPSCPPISVVLLSLLAAQDATVSSNRLRALDGQACPVCHFKPST